MSWFVKRSLLILCAALLCATPAAALTTPETQQYYTNNNIIFYGDFDPSGGCGSVAGDIPYSTTKLDASMLAKLDEKHDALTMNGDPDGPDVSVKELYKSVGEQRGVAWEMLAAIDYRENNNTYNKSMLGGEPLGQKAEDSDRAPKTKAESINMGVDTLISLSKGVYGVTVSPQMQYEDLQKSFLAYNRGYLYFRANNYSPDASPYVMNNFDEAHKSMTWPPHPPEPTHMAGKIERDRYGAMTVYANLIQRLNPKDNVGCPEGAVGAKVDYTGIYPDMDAGTLHRLRPELLCTPRPSKPKFQLLKGPACASFIALDKAYKAKFGKEMPVGQGYRTAEEQIACGGTESNPGGYNPACARYRPKNTPPEHLWGTAIDFSGPLSNDGTSEHLWLVANGPKYGWFWPNFAREGRGGNAGVKEPWHFQYYFVGHDPSTDKLEAFK